jgi:hypothetical protein
MVKSLPPPTKVGFPWRDGRAAEGACLENMFGESQRGFESHSLRLAIDVSEIMVTISIVKRTWGGARVAEWARLLSECRA